MNREAAKYELADIKEAKRQIAHGFKKSSKAFDRHMARLNRRETKLLEQLAAH